MQGARASRPFSNDHGDPSGGARPVPASLVACWLLLVAAIPAAEPLPLGSAFWQDPNFVRSFNGSYRIEARIEPAVTSDERALLVEVQELMAKGARKAALDKLAASKLTAGSPALRFNLGNLRLEEGEVEQAAADYQAAIQQYPSFRRAHRNLAVATARLGKPQEALPSLLEALRLGDSDGTTWGLLGWCRLQASEFAGALQAYRMAQALEPDTAEWLAGIAQCLQQLGQDAEAAELLDEVVRKRPNEPSYALLRADLLVRLGRTSAAAAGLDLLRRLGVLDADGHLFLALLHLRGARDELAAVAATAAFAAPAPPATERLLATLREAVDRKAWDLAVLLDRKAAAALADGERAEKRQLVLLGARIAIESGADPAGGAKRLEELLRDDPLDGGALLVLGRQRAADGRREEAEILLERAAKVDEFAHEAWVEVARVRVDQRRYPQALEAVDKALAVREHPPLRAYREALAGLVEAGR